MTALTKGLFISEPYLYKDPETGETRHIVEKLYGTFNYLFMGNPKRPIVHVLAASKATADQLALNTYRAAKIADGWDAELVDKHIQRLMKPSEYVVSQDGNEFTFKATNSGMGQPVKGDPRIGEMHKLFFDGTEVWKVGGSQNPGIDSRLVYYFLGLITGKNVNGTKTMGTVYKEIPSAAVYSNYIYGPDSSIRGTSACKWLVPVVATRSAGKVVIEGKDDNSGYFIIDGKETWGAQPDGSVPVDGALMAWRITGSAPSMFKGLVLHVRCMQNGKDVEPQAYIVAKTMVAPNKTALTAELAELVTAGEASWKGFQGWLSGVTPYTPPAGSSGLPSRIPSRGYLLTMPDGLSSYAFSMSNPKNGTVLGVDGAIAARVWEEMVIGFPQLADMIEFQIDSGTDAQKKTMQDSLDKLRDQPDGFVNLVQYAAMQPLPFDPLSRTMLEKFAQRAETSVKDEKMADEEKHAVSWGLANKRVNDLEQADYFVVINDPETQRLGFKVSPWVGSPATHVLQFGNSSQGIRCRLALTNGSVVGGMDPLVPEEALNYSQLGYVFTYDASLSELQDPLTKVMTDFFTGFSREDLSVPDPETGKALSPDSVLNQSLDISDCYEGGSLFFPKVAANRKDMVALMNKGVDQPENLRALLQQTSVAVFGAMISDASLYPNLD